MTMDLDAIAAFVAVARTGSFRAAAAERGVSASALSHAVAKLERGLGVRLLTRSTRAIALTEAGERLMAAAGPALMDMAAAIESLDALRDAPVGRVKLTVPRIAALTVLADALPAFLAAYPGISLDISVSDAFQDLAAHGFDAGIRLGEALRPNMVAVPIGPPIAMAVVAAPDYLKTAQPIAMPDDLRAHRCIGFKLQTSGEPYHWEFARDGRVVEVLVPSQLIVDDQEMNLAAATKGLGLAYTGLDYALPLIREGRLARVLEDWTLPDERFYLYYPSRKHQSSALRALVAHLRGAREPG